MKGVAYARYSSDNQREESIEAQLRAIHAYAVQKGIEITHEYVDRAKSATTDHRPEFQNMIYDSSFGDFDVILIHKLDRFARSRYDSAVYKRKLQNNGVKVISIMENLDDTPESVILEGLLDAMSEYYSKNLSREVHKGQKENALKCMHNGGIPPLGYDVNPVTKRYEINPEEAVTVRYIFKSIKEGMGYDTLIHQLNSRGMKTKLGNTFGKNSIHEILKNEKYRGCYVFNRSASKSVSGKRNNHANKTDEDVIRIEEGVPKIVSDDDFESVQSLLNKRVHRSDSNGNSKEVYLLSGKIFCGECQQSYSGNKKHGGRNKTIHVTYRCNNRSSKSGIICKNKEVNRDYVERYVLDILADVIFNPDRIPTLVDNYNHSLDEEEFEWRDQVDFMNKQIQKLEHKITNLTNVIAESGSTALLKALSSAESGKEKLEQQIREFTKTHQKIEVDKSVIVKAFYQAKEMLINGQLPETKQLINLYVDRVVVCKDCVKVSINTFELVISAATNKNIRENGIKSWFEQKYELNRKDLNYRYKQRDETVNR